MAAPFWSPDPADARAVLIRLKVVPGSSRDQIVGMLGDRLKVKVAAAPEDGKANAAVCHLLAKALGLPNAAVAIESGHSRPEKVARVTGVSPAAPADVAKLDALAA